MQRALDGNTALSGGGRFGLVNLALMPSWRCDVACYHCVFTSSPKVAGQLPRAHALAAIDELAAITAFERVTVSGGEPFLDLDYLVAVAQRTRSLGRAFRVVTNGSFAVDEVTALSRIGPLAKLGLETLGLSWDRFHSPFVPAERARLTIRACRQLGVSVRVTVVASRREGVAEALADLGDDGFELPVTQVKCLPVGRAERKVPVEQLLPPAPIDLNRACRRDFDTLSLTPSGDVYPCCAVGGFTEGIRLGRYPNSTMSELLTRRDHEFPWILLARQGPRRLLAELSAAELREIGLGSIDVHDCVACHRLFRHPLAAEALTRLKARIAAQVAPMLASWPDARV